MKLIIAALISAALIWLTSSGTPVNNSGHKAAETRTAKATTIKRSEPRVEVASQVQAPAPQTQVAQIETQGCDAYRSTFAQYSWNVNTAIAICKAESNGNTNAISPTLDRGLMQINWIHADMVNGDLNALYDPTTNISVAHRVYLSQGWNGWTTYTSRAYLAYLN